MIESLRLINFRNFENFHTQFGNTTTIIGPNGIGKTNILHALCYIFFHHHSSLPVAHLKKQGENQTFLEVFFSQDDISYKLTAQIDGEKKKFFLNGKNISQIKLKDFLPKVSFFEPRHLNLFYLGPKARRDFLDDILSNIFPEYKKNLSQYQKIVQSRNKTLKNIKDGLSQKKELIFWNETLIKTAQEIYQKRFPLIDFLQENLGKYNVFLSTSPQKMLFTYNTKVNKEDIAGSMSEYLQQNLERDIILSQTHIGPHRDDFNIFIENIEITQYASRGELKSIIFLLKIIELDYIKYITQKIPILLIDDFQSELDNTHQDLLLSHIKNTQIILSSISPILNRDSLEISLKKER